MYIAPDRKTAGELFDELCTAALKAGARPTKENIARVEQLELVCSRLANAHPEVWKLLQEKLADVTLAQWDAQEVMNTFQSRTTDEIYNAVVESQRLNLMRKQYIKEIDTLFDHTRGLEYVPKTYE